MKSFFFQVLYCGYKRFGQRFLIFFWPWRENPHGSNENSNTIYRSDLTHCLNAGEAVHSRLRKVEARAPAIVFLLKLRTVICTTMKIQDQCMLNTCNQKDVASKRLLTGNSQFWVTCSRAPQQDYSMSEPLQLWDHFTIFRNWNHKNLRDTSKSTLCAGEHASLTRHT